MANEAVIIELYGEPKGEGLQYTVSGGVAISAGTLLALTDPRTAAANTGEGEAFAGIAAADKESTDGATTLGVYNKGIFDLLTAGATTVGQLVWMSGANTVTAGSNQLSAANHLAAGRIVGKALETGTNAEVIAVKVGSVI